MPSLTQGEAKTAIDNRETQMRLAADRYAQAVGPMVVDLSNKYPRADLTGLVTLLAKLAPSPEEILFGATPEITAK